MEFLSAPVVVPSASASAHSQRSTTKELPCVCYLVNEVTMMVFGAALITDIYDWSGASGICFVLFSAFFWFFRSMGIREISYKEEIRDCAIASSCGFIFSTKAYE